MKGCVIIFQLMGLATRVYRVLDRRWRSVLLGLDTLERYRRLLSGLKGNNTPWYVNVMY